MSPLDSKDSRVVPKDADGRLILRQRKVQANWTEVRNFLRRLEAEVTGTPFSVCMLSNRGMRQYNRRFRKRSESTDVLCFPIGRRGTKLEYLGDILISAEIAAQRASRLGIRTEDEMKALVLHGILHLMGYDHERDSKMVRAEKRWGKRLGLPRTLLGGLCTMTSRTVS